MKSFITEDFLLQTDVARELYHNYAEPQPIFDYHSHLPAQLIAENHRFSSIAEAWLAGDHYKWRAMRANGVEEKYCTGAATPKEKFLAYARTVPNALRNPLYHWTHLELLRYFGIGELLDEGSAEAIWENANAQLAAMPAQELLRKSRVAVACTTDDPADSLEWHIRIREEGKCSARVYPAFRPDKALLADQPEAFNAWLDELSAVSGIECGTLQNFLAALDKRHAFFHEFGARLSDHSLPYCEGAECPEAEAARCFDAARAGRLLTPEEGAKFRAFMMLFFGQLDAARGWTKQLHLGALRNTNTRSLRELGPDTGYDSIGDWPQAAGLARLLDQMNSAGALPKMILYNLNPADNTMLASMTGNFQGGGVPGKIQFGSAWWFLDQKDGIEQQLNALSNLGLLSRFVGMLTDSRSFLSFPRHEYFRRILCNLIGNDVARGELPRDMELLGNLVADVSYRNAQRYFGMETPTI